MTEATNPPTSNTNFIRRWLIRVTIFAILLAMLVIANLVYATIDTTEIILEKPANELLYVSAFDGFLDEWELYEGQQSAQIVDDTMQLDVTSIGQATWSTAQPTFADFDLTVETQAIIDPNNPVIDNAFGVIFRLQSGADTQCDLPYIILCGVGDTIPILNIGIRQLVNSSAGANSINYYTFLISSDGYYSVWRVEDGVEKRLSAWIQTPAINQDLNAKNTVRVVARGSQFQFFINGEQVLLCIPNNPDAISTYSGGECFDGTMQGVLTDTTIPTGQIGVIAQATQTGGGGVVIQFDNLTVFSPSNDIAGGESNA